MQPFAVDLRGTMCRLQSQSFRDFFLPCRLAKGSAVLHTLLWRFPLRIVVSVIDPLNPIRWHMEMTDTGATQIAETIRRKTSLVPTLFARLVTLNE